MIHLQQVDESNWQDAMGLAVRPEQQRFIADNLPIVAVALSKAYIRPGGLTWLPYVIYDEQQMVGFVEIAFDGNGSSPCWLYHFFVDYRYQGRGYSKRAMVALVAFIKLAHPQVTGITLAVHPENLVAKRLYEHIGFQLTGEEKWGEPVYRLDFV